MTLLVCLLLGSLILNILLLNFYFQWRSDRAWHDQQEARRVELLTERWEQEEKESREMEVALDWLWLKVIAFEYDLFDTDPDVEAERELHCFDLDLPYRLPDLPEAHRPYYEQFQLLEKSITFLYQRFGEVGICHEEIEFYEQLLVELWNTYRKQCSREQLSEFSISELKATA